MSSTKTVVSTPAAAPAAKPTHVWVREGRGTHVLLKGKSKSPVFTVTGNRADGFRVLTAKGTKSKTVYSSIRQAKRAVEDKLPEGSIASVLSEHQVDDES